MMYAELVKGTMNNQKEARKEFRLAQAKEREVVAIDILEDAKCAVKELKCEHLLDDNKEEVVNTISINKGKIVKVEVEKIVPREIVKEVVKTKEVKIVDEETLKQLEIARKTASTWQAKANKLENTISEKDNYIAKLKAEIESLKAIKEKTKEPVEEFDYFSSPEYQEYIAMEAEMAESNECSISVENVKPEPKKQEAVKLEQLNVKLQKYSNANIYKYNNGYLIASPKAQEITWLPNGHEALSQQAKDSIVNELVKTYKFPTNRVSVSPYVVTKSNAYFARVAAMDGVETFSPSDIFAGYVFYQGQYFLFTYMPEGHSNKVFIDDFNKKIQGQIARPSKAKIQVITNLVMDMYEEYKALITKDVKVEEPKVEIKKEIKEVTDNNFDNVVNKISAIAKRQQAKRVASIHKKTKSPQEMLASMYNFSEETIKGDGKQNNKLNSSAQDRLAMMLGK